MGKGPVEDTRTETQTVDPPFTDYVFLPATILVALKFIFLTYKNTILSQTVLEFKLIYL